MMFSIQLLEPSRHIVAQSVQELENALSFLNPLMLGRAKTILEKQYKMTIFESGKNVKCVALKRKEPIITVVFIKQKL